MFVGAAGTLLLSGSLLADGTKRDILIEDGKIAGLGMPAPPGAAVIDLAGRLVLPALIDVHVHLDKTLLGLPWQPHRAENATLGRIEAEKTLRRSLGWGVGRSGAALLSLALSKGTTAVRSHVDVDEVTGLKNVEAVLELREVWKEVVDIQIVAFPQSGIRRCPGVAELLDEALVMGCDLVGGLDPVGIDGDLDGHLDAIFGVAETHDCGLDIHLHDQGEQGLGEILAIAQRAKAGFSGRVTVSHAFCLGSVAPERAIYAADQLAEAGVTILTSAPGAAPMPPVALLRKAGVRVVAGSDNVRDAWSPFGNADMLERCWLVAYRCGLRTDEDIAGTLDLATCNAAALLGLERTLKVGHTADLMAVSALTPALAVIERPCPDLVLRRGRVAHHAFQLPDNVPRVAVPRAAA